jgi:hypothetical protein
MAPASAPVAVRTLRSSVIGAFEIGATPARRPARTTPRRSPSPPHRRVRVDLADDLEPLSVWDLIAD